MATYIETGKVYKKGVNIQGSTSNVDTATNTDIWVGANTGVSTVIWVPPTEARVHAIVSTSIADDGDPVGTGAHSVLIEGLDSNWLEISETVTLNGTGSVNTTNSYIRINKMTVNASGTGNTNAGIIKATAATDATVTCAIATGKGRSQSAIYSVPAGYKFELKDYYASIRRGTGSGVNADMVIYERTGADASTSTWTVLNERGVYLDGSDGFEHRFDPPHIILEKSDIRISAEGCSANDTPIFAGFDGYIEFVPS